MQVKLAYGRHGMVAELPDSVDVIRPRFVPGLTDEKSALPDALHDPIAGRALNQLAQPGDRVVIVHTNITRGYPLDQNLYQAVKGMKAAAGVVKKGGSIIVAAACEDGVPDHGKYAQLLAETGSPQGILDMLARSGFAEHDQWQIQMQAHIQLHADVFVYSDGLTADQIERALFNPCTSIE